MQIINLTDLLKKFLRDAVEQTPGEDEEKWPTVAVLKPEDITRRKAVRSDRSRIRGEAKVLSDKLAALEAEEKALHSAFWEHLNSTYSLPRDAEYTITDDNHVRIKPGSEGKVTCICGRCK